MNNWEFEGKIMFIRREPYEVGQSITLKGTHRLRSGISYPVEMGVIVPLDVWQDLKDNQIQLYDKLALKGHFETWVKTAHNGKEKQTLMRIADEVVNFELL